MRLRHSISAFAISLALAACGGDSTPDTTADAAPTTVASNDATTSDASAEAVPVVFDTVAGGQIDLGALEGQDTVLWFWAPW